MKNPRKPSFTRILCLFLFTVMFYVGCSPEQSIVEEIEQVEQSIAKSDCSDIELEIRSSLELPNQIESSFKKIQVALNNTKYTTVREYFKDYFNSEPELEVYMKRYEEHIERYKELGFEKYIISEQEKGILSKKLSNYLNKFKIHLEAFFSHKEPTLEQYIKFLAIKKDELKKSELCSKDLDFMNVYLDLIQGYAQFYYKEKGIIDTGTIAYAKDCEGFWENLGCGSLGITVGVVTIGVGIFVSASQGDSGWAWVVGGVWWGINTYNWCCDLDNDDDDVTCEAPTRIDFTYNGCNQVTATIIGTSTYESTVWTNNNTSPSSITTNGPSLTFSVPDHSTVSTLSAVTTCTNSDGGVTSISNFSISDTRQLYEPLNITWAELPPNPSHYTPEFSIPTASVSGSGISGNHISYNWSISSPHDISGTGNSVGIIFREPGTATINVTVTNTCIGQSQSLTYTTTVIE